MSNIIATKISNRDMKIVDKLIEKGEYNSKSDLARTAIRNLIKKPDNENGGM